MSVDSSWDLRRLVASTFPLLVVLSALEIGSGVILEGLRDSYLNNPSLLVLVPVMIGMGGNLGSMLSSRLSTRLHLGTTRLDPRDPVVASNIVAVFGLALTVFVLLGFSTYGLGRTVIQGSLSLATVLTVSVLSGTVLASVVVVVSLVATYLAYVTGVDPDDVVIPVVTNVCDILGVVILTAVVILVV